MFHIVDPKLIRAGEVTDVYFSRTREILSREGLDPEVVMEVRARAFPRDWSWAVLAGVEENLELLPLVDAYGVGTSISNAPVIDFAMDIVEIDRTAYGQAGQGIGAEALVGLRRLRRPRLAF